MSEKLTYDPQVAEMAVEHYDAAKDAVNHLRGVERNVEVNNRIAEIAAKGLFGRLRARNERKRLENELSQGPSEMAYDTETAEAIIIPSINLDNAHSSVADTVAEASRFAQQEASALYDNAVIEADTSFINDRRPERIQTPAVVQAHADQAMANISPSVNLTK